MTESAATDVDQLAINTIRFLAVDMVERAKSGHPGAPMGQAALAYLLWTRYLRHDPSRPDWPDRDRFVLSCGHASALIYALLHLSGYDLPMEQLRSFRQLGSRTPGHPENFVTAGVETTTGPLGQDSATPSGWRSRAACWRRGQPVGVPDLRPPRLGDGERRRPDGGVTSEASSGPATSASGAGGLLRRQPDLDRRLDRPDVQRGRGHTLRGLRLARRAGGRRQRPRGAGHGDRGGSRRHRPSVAGHRPHPHRLRQPEHAGTPRPRTGHRSGPRRSKPRSATSAGR